MRKVDSHLVGLPSVKGREREREKGLLKHKIHILKSLHQLHVLFDLNHLLCCVCLSTADPDSIQGCMRGLGQGCLGTGVCVCGQSEEGSVWVSKAVGSSMVYLRQGGGTHTLLTHTSHEPHRGEWLHTQTQIKILR